ncbi:MAG TPA: hypothetical protein VL346_08870 [Acidobacteriaceae bacterium]|nr:hypothetical protein [Acidobacteriaceae bacterium]
MKTTLRVLALTSLAAAFVAGASVPKNNAIAAAVLHSSVPGPIPLCNPLTQNCPNIRGKR